MKYMVQLTIEDICQLDLFEIDIPPSECRNAQDAINCELEYNNVDWKF